MHKRINWLDEVREPDRTFSFTNNGDGTMTFARAGRQIQQGTNQNAANFNTMEDGIVAATLGVDLLFSYVGMKLGFSEESLDSLAAALIAEIGKLTSGTTVPKYAKMLETARSIAISGGATGTATNFDGSGNISIPVTSLDATKLTGKVAITNGGTNANDAAGARANLDVPSKADLTAAAILQSAIECTTQAYQRDLDGRLALVEAQLAALTA